MCPESLLFHLSLCHFFFHSILCTPHSFFPLLFCLSPPPPPSPTLPSRPLPVLLPHSLSQGPCVPVCNISKAVRRPGQGKQPSSGFRGEGGRDVFLRNPGTPLRLLAEARGGLKGEDDPLHCSTKQEHKMLNISFFLFSDFPLFWLFPRCFLWLVLWICV